MITLIAPSAALIVISKLEIFDRVLSTVHIPLELVLQVPMFWYTAIVSRHLENKFQRNMDGR
jgi:hypothetical protein